MEITMRKPCAEQLSWEISEINERSQRKELENGVIRCGNGNWQEQWDSCRIVQWRNRPSKLLGNEQRIAWPSRENLDYRRVLKTDQNFVKIGEIYHKIWSPAAILVKIGKFCARDYCKEISVQNENPVRAP
jgi:hypothetical protein